MIVTCPSCHNKYSVQAEAIGEGKLVRCVMCGTTWQQVAVKEPASAYRGVRILEWAFFWSMVFLSLFFLFFARNSVVNIWPPAISFYRMFENNPVSRTETIKLNKLSSFFAYKNGDLYMGLKGEVQNISNEVQILPGINIKLKDDGDKCSFISGVSSSKQSFQKSWTHNMEYQKILPNQKVSFETKVQKVPCTNILCDIQLVTL